MAPMAGDPNTDEIFPLGFSQRILDLLLQALLDAFVQQALALACGDGKNGSKDHTDRLKGEEHATVCALHGTTAPHTNTQEIREEGPSIKRWISPRVPGGGMACTTPAAQRGRFALKPQVGHLWYVSDSWSSASTQCTSCLYPVAVHQLVSSDSVSRASSNASHRLHSPVGTQTHCDRPWRSEPQSTGADVALPPRRTRCQ
eukprot:m.360590 g.360590  ORF g.360590 m.360590 type:complete len:201 (+) comp20770_c0_seq10:504-1106(+)